MTYTSLATPRRSHSLQSLSYLNPRMSLSVSDKVTFENLKKGYEGELNFAKLLDKELMVDCLKIYGLHIKVNQTEYQIDSLIITQSTVYLFEVKNFNGDFYVKNDRWYAVESKKEIRNPTHQLKRSELLLHQLLNGLGYNISVEAYIIFINPGFFLYQAPLDHSLVVPNQLQRFMKKLNNNNTGKLSSYHNKLAEQLANRHIPISAHEILPDYTYEGLKKGMVCNLCFDFLLPIKGSMSFRCDQCNHEVNAEIAVMQSVAQFKMLFPQRKITVTSIYDWCEIVNTKRRIRRILMKNMKLIRNGKYSYYIYN